MLKSLHRKLLSDLRINRGQFLAVWFVVMLGVAFYGAMYPSGVNMLASFYKTYDEMNYLHFQLQFDPTSEDMVGQAGDIDGIEETEGRLVVDTGLQLDPDYRYLITLRLISVPDEGDPQVNRSDIVDGRAIQADDEVLLLKSFADKHGLEVGDTLSVWVDGTEHPLTIAGLAFNPEYIILGRSPSAPFPSPSTFGVAWIRYTPLAMLTDRVGEMNEVVIHLEGKSADENTELADRVRQSLVEAYASANNLTILAREETASGSVVQANIDGNFPIMIFFSSVFLMGSVVMTGILLGRVVQGERRRIGTMRALGITRRELIVHYLSYGLIIGVTGGIVGTVFGYLNSFWVMGVYIQLIAGGTLPAFTNLPQWDFLLLGFVIAVVGATLAGIYPAWKESATPPGIALRPATPNNPGQLSQMAAVPFFPLPVRQALRNLLRSPGRSLSTALGVALGAMMIFSTYAMWDSFNPSLADYYAAYDFDMRVEMQAFPLPPVGDAVEESIHTVDGVQDVQAALIGFVSLVNAEGESLDAIAVSVDETAPFLDLKNLEGAEPFSSADGIWIGNNTQRILKLDVGDIVTATALGQTTEFEVLGVVSHTIGAPIFVPRSLMVQFILGGQFRANFAFVRAEETRTDRVREAVADLPGVVAIEMFDEYRSDIDTYVMFFRTGTLIFGGFGYILTLAVLFNTVNASLRERQGELAVLRALGNSAREIAIIIVLELLIMTVIGGLVGIPIGREMGHYLQGSYDGVAYNAVLGMTTLSYILGMASLLIIVLVSVIPGLRAVQKVDLGQVSKSQSL